MAHTFKLVFPALLFTLFLQGIYGKCDLNNLTIGTVRTDQIIGGKQEWQVTITNECTCPLSNLYLDCKGFDTVEPVSPSVFKKVGDICVVVQGERIFPKQTINFKYAWDPPFLLFPAKGNYEC